MKVILLEIEYPKDSFLGYQVELTLDEVTDIHQQIERGVSLCTVKTQLRNNGKELTSVDIRKVGKSIDHIIVR